MPLYSLAISPDQRVTELVRGMKKNLRERLDRHFGSANSLAYITLITFFADDQTYPIILQEFRRVLFSLTSFDFGFAGYDDFPPKPDCVFYVRPDEASEEKTLGHCQKIAAHFSKFVRKKYTDRWKAVKKGELHMTIARELTPVEVQICYELFPVDFDATFQCDAFVMRKFNPEKGQYDIIDTIPLLGHEYMAGQQMRLF